jgi:hypothetical protein
MFQINEDLKVKIINIEEKIFFVIDNFYKDPDQVREYAINSKKYKDEDLLAGAIGKRVCEDDLRLSYYMKDVFEELCKHPKWHIEFDKDHHEYKWSGMRFMVNVTNNSEIIKDGRSNIEHLDGPLNKWACVVYLNTPEECEGGTDFYRWNGDYNSRPILEYTAEMTYNRAILYDANMVHGAVLRPGMFVNCDRLVQVMFM